MGVPSVYLVTLRFFTTQTWMHIVIVCALAVPIYKRTVKKSINFLITLCWLVKNNSTPNGIIQDDPELENCKKN